MPGNRQVFEKAMSDGHSAAWDLQWEQAALHYQAAVQEFPENTSALSNLGLALFETGKFEQALEIYQRVSILQPDDPLAMDKMARIYERLGRLAEAVRAGMQAAELHLKARDVEKSIENWLRVASLQPTNLTVHTRLALVYERLGKKPEAVREYLAAASLMQQAGEIQKAFQIVNYALKMMPGSAEATQALQLLRLGKPLPKPVRPRGGTGPVLMAEVRQMEGQEDSVARLDPIAEARQRALVELAELLFSPTDEDGEGAGQTGRRGVSALARGTGGLTLDRSTQTRVQLHLAQAIESQTHGEDQQAIEELERAQSTGFSHPALHFDLGMLLVERDGEKALRSLVKAVRHPEYALASHLLMGKIYFNREAYAEAAVAYLQALRLADVETVPADQQNELRQLYEPVIEMQANRRDADAHKALCETIAAQLEQADWRAYLLKARQQMPAQSEGFPPMPVSEMLLESRSGQVIEALANIRRLAGAGLVRTALEEAYFALDHAPTYLPLHAQIGDLLLSENRPVDAVEKYRLVAELYTLRGEPAQAVNLLLRVSQLLPMNTALRSKLIELLVEQGRVDDAIQQYLELADIHYRLAELELTRQTYLAALRLVQQSARNRQWAYQILNHLADIDMQRLDWRQALRFYEQMRTLQPDDQSVRARIINLNFRLGQENAALSELDSYLNILEGNQRREAAQEFMRQLIEDQPGKAGLHRRLADLYLRDGKTAQAIAQLDALADALMEAGEREQAIAVLVEIIGLNPENRADYESALTRLRAGT